MNKQFNMAKMKRDLNAAYAKKEKRLAGHSYNGSLIRNMGGKWWVNEIPVPFPTLTSAKHRVDTIIAYLKQTAAA